MSTWFTRCATALVMVALASNALADPIPPGGQGDRLKVIGFSGLDGHYGAFKMALNHAANGRWYLYMGHSFDLGWSILDVTNAQDPKYVKFIPYDGPKDWITSQVTVHGNLMITSLDRRNAPGPDMIFWDVSDPINPKEIARWGNGLARPGGRWCGRATTGRRSCRGWRRSMPAWASQARARPAGIARARMVWRPRRPAADTRWRRPART